MTVTYVPRGDERKNRGRGFATTGSKPVEPQADLAVTSKLWLGEDIRQVQKVGSDNPVLELTETGVVPDIYNQVEVDSKGRVVRAWKTTGSSTVDGSRVTEGFDVTDSSDKNYDLLYTPIVGTVQVWLNGLCNFEGPADDFTISANLITFNNDVTLTVGDRIKVMYQY